MKNLSKKKTVEELELENQTIVMNSISLGLNYCMYRYKNTKSERLKAKFMDKIRYHLFRVMWSVIPTYTTWEFRHQVREAIIEMAEYDNVTPEYVLEGWSRWFNYNNQ